MEGCCLLDCGALYYGRYLLRDGTKLLPESSVKNGNLVYGNWEKSILRGLFPTYQIKRQVPKTLHFLLPSRKVQISHFNAKMCSSISSNRKLIEGILRRRAYMYVKKMFAGISTLWNLDQVVWPLALRLPLKAFRLLTRQGTALWKHKVFSFHMIGRIKTYHFPKQRKTSWIF
jgi:hypothetical protein